jgi:putative CocE/NonD family hydrolase
LRNRNSELEPTLLEPGKVYEVTVDVGATANVFLPGHQIRLEITSSSFPHFARNTNTGGTIATDRAVVVATNSVHHDTVHASHLVLPIIDREM